MLKELTVENIAIIKKLTLSFDGALTVLTGETGAGKSVLLHAIGLVMGNRASKELVRTGEEKATVTALFEPIGRDTAAVADALGIDTDDALFLQREITASGGSTARINGKIVPLSMLRELAVPLLSLHGQHDTKALLDEESYLPFLDAFADCAEEKEAFAVLYDEASEVRRRLSAVVRDEKEKARMIELLKYQLADIDAVRPREGEEEELLRKRLKLQNAEKIGKHAKLIYRALYQNDKGLSASDLTEKAIEALGNLESVLPDAPALAEALTDIRYRMEDIAETVHRECDMGVKNPTELLDKIETRLDAIARLRKKYGSTVGEILAYRKESEDKLKALERAEELCEDLENEFSVLRGKMRTAAAMITEKRKAAAKSLEKKITDELIFLDMEKVRFHIDIAPLTDFSREGADKVTFLVSANIGEPLLSLSKVASGGELSRMMLALKCAFADKEHTGTLIFDEIDTGISGKTSHKIGVKLREVSKSGTQVLCVTHSPQIAAMAKTHLFVSKAETDGRTESHVRPLDKEERIHEIARIIGGAKITEKTLAAANALLSEEE